jgi:hypothetical protein
LPSKRESGDDEEPLSDINEPILEDPELRLLLVLLVLLRVELLGEETGASNDGGPPRALFESRLAILRTVDANVELEDARVAGIISCGGVGGNLA